MCIYIYICTSIHNCITLILLITRIIIQSVIVNTFDMIIIIIINASTVSFHNFKSQNLKLSVSSPKSKHVACLSVLSRISNSQSLGRKNEHEISKTDRSTPAGRGLDREGPRSSLCQHG